MLQLAVLTLVTSLQACVPGVAPQTMAAIVSVESGGRPLTIHDNTAARSYSFPDRAGAATTAYALLAHGHSIDLGLAQINSANLASLGLSAADAFDPCTNLRAGATILRAAYAEAERRFGPGQTALRHALGAYNSGSLFGAPEYVRRVLTAAGVAA